MKPVQSKNSREVRAGGVGNIPEGAVHTSQQIIDFCVGEGWLTKSADGFVSEKERTRIPFTDAELNGLRVVGGYGCLWSNREIKDDMDPYSVPLSYVDELLSHHDQGNYIVFGMAGHGVQSWCFHLFVVEKDLAYFAQIPWGNFDQMREGPGTAAAKSDVMSLFSGFKSARELVKKAHQDGKFTHGERLVIVDIQHGETERKAAVMNKDTDSGSVKWTQTSALFRTPFAVATSLVNGTK